MQKHTVQQSETNNVTLQVHIGGKSDQPNPPGPTESGYSFVFANASDPVATVRIDLAALDLIRAALLFAMSHPEAETGIRWGQYETWLLGPINNLRHDMENSCGEAARA